MDPVEIAFFFLDKCLVTSIFKHAHSQIMYFIVDWLALIYQETTHHSFHSFPWTPKVETILTQEDLWKSGENQSQGLSLVKPKKKIPSLSFQDILKQTLPW